VKQEDFLMNNHLSLQQAKLYLQQSGKEFQALFQHGTLAVELYKPDKTDKQTPHTRDEVYIIAAGNGQFNLNGEITTVTTGDFLFVPAYAPHYFFDFTDDFSTWVLFYGVEGGE
jgi:mannose-6-phosphate isomerase-like protein (cupin superfamily)